MDLMQTERKNLLEVLRDLEAMTLPLNGEGRKGVAPGYSIHLAEDATENIQTETALMIRRDEENALIQVEAAIQRHGEGLFGVCLGCGKKIGMSRLKVMPSAHLCMKCKTTYDKKSRSRR